MLSYVIAVLITGWRWIEYRGIGGTHRRPAVEECTTSCGLLSRR